MMTVVVTKVVGVHYGDDAEVVCWWLECVLLIVCLFNVLIKQIPLESTLVNPVCNAATY